MKFTDAGQALRLTGIVKLAFPGRQCIDTVIRTSDTNNKPKTPTFIRILVHGRVASLPFAARILGVDIRVHGQRLNSGAV